MFISTCSPAVTTKASIRDRGHLTLHIHHWLPLDVANGIGSLLGVPPGKFQPGLAQMIYWQWALGVVLCAPIILFLCPFIQIFFDGLWPGRQELLAARGKAIRHAVKTELAAFIAELGFKKNRKPLASDGSEQPWGNTYSRQRGEFFDEIHFKWDHYGGPRFAIEFWTDQTERMIVPGAKPPYVYLGSCFYYASIRPRRNRPWEWIGQVQYGQGQSLRQAMATAKKRLLDLDEYLRTGVTSAPLKLLTIVTMGKDRPLELFPPEPPTFLERFGKWVWRKRF